MERKKLALANNEKTFCRSFMIGVLVTILALLCVIDFSFSQRTSTRAFAELATNATSNIDGQSDAQGSSTVSFEIDSSLDQNPEEINDGNILEQTQAAITELVGGLGSQGFEGTGDSFLAILLELVVGSIGGSIAILVLLRVRTSRSQISSSYGFQKMGCLALPLNLVGTPAAPNKKTRNKGKTARKNRKWIALYAITIILWSIVFTTTVRSWLIGTEAVVDSLDISFFTFPVLALNLVFLAATFLIFGVYFGCYHAAVRQQRQALCKPSVGDAELADGMMKIHDNSVNSKTRRQLCSIIIPARDEESVIKSTILSCLAQSYRNIEVVIVCHNCSDNTYAQAGSIMDSRVRAFELKTKEAGKGIALNYGVEKSKGSFLLILDGDGRLNDTFIEDAMPFFEIDDYAAVQGRYIPSNRNYNFITRMLSLEGDLWSTPFMTFRNIGKKRTPLGGTGYMIRKDILLKVGGFANHLVDDYELTFRLLRNNYQIVYAPLCINYDEKPPNLNIMLNQRARWLRGFLNLMKSRVAEPRDVMGNLFWINPLTAFTGFALLLIAAYSTIHYLAFLYYPFQYSYIPLTIWFALTLATFALYTAALVMQYGKSGFKYALWLPIYLPFSNYYMIVALKAFFVKSWAETKTTHGYAAENIQGSQSTVLKEKDG